MSVSASTFIQDSVIFLRDLLLNGVTDPLGSRSGNFKFVMTSYPERSAKYPLITVKNSNIKADRSGMRSEDMNAALGFEIRIWARNVKERDSLTQAVIDKLRNSQTDATTGSIDFNLFGLSIDSAVDIDEEGEHGIHSKVLEITYYAYLDS